MAQLNLEYTTLKEKSEAQITSLEQRNQDIQDLLASNPKTRPIMIEKTLETVKSSFGELEHIFKEDQEKADKINDLENQLEEAQNELKLTKNDLQNQIKQLKESLENSKDIAALELKFEFEEEK